MTEVSGLSSESRRSLLHNIAMGLSETPSPDAKIFKDECTYCFNTPFSPGWFSLLKLNTLIVDDGTGVNVINYFYKEISCIQKSLNIIY